MNEPVCVVVSGLTAAGKTTHAKLLARHFDIPYFAMLPIMTTVLRERHPSSKISRKWDPTRDEVRAHDDEVDLEADRRMRAAIEQRSGVFDAWALPWLYTEPGAIRVWIESDAPSRHRKCIVSALMQGDEPPSAPAKLVDLKDEFSRERFRRLYGFELEPSREVFDIVLDNTGLIPEASVACAERGIAAFHPRLTEAVERIMQAR